MQATVRYFTDSRVVEPERAEAEDWLRRQGRWEGRLAELRRPHPRPAVGNAGTPRRPAA